MIALDSKGGKIVVKGWQEATDLTAEEVIQPAGALLRRLPLHLCRQGRHDAGDRSGLVPPPPRSDTLEITAAGGITTLDDIRALRDANITRRSGWRSTPAGWT